MIFERDSPIKMDDDWYHSRSPDWSKVTILGCLRGTFRPSRRQMRSTRLWFTCQPSGLRSAVMRRYP